MEGRSIKEVAEELRSGRLSPDQFRVVAFRHGDQLITNNNRSLAVLSRAGLRPTNLVIIEPDGLHGAIANGLVDPDIIDRLAEPTPLGDVLPSNRIVITPSQEDRTIVDPNDDIIYLPGERP